MVYVGSNRDYLYAISASTGVLSWSYSAGSRDVRSSPAVADGFVYVGSNSGFLYMLSTDGVLQWSKDTGGAVRSSPVVAYGMVFVGSDSNYTYAFNASAADNQQNTYVWRFLTNGAVRALTVAEGIMFQRTVFVGTNGGGVYALKAQSGEKIWEFQAPGAVTTSSASYPAFRSSGSTNYILSVAMGRIGLLTEYQQRADSGT